jgi:hypothetical protein
MQWAHAIFVILIVAVAWGAVFMWTEVFEHVIRDALKLPADSKTSKMILAVILTAVFFVCSISHWRSSTHRSSNWRSSCTSTRTFDGTTSCSSSRVIIDVDAFARFQLY